MLAAVVLTLLGVALSAYFSGSETGFYRVTRVRLVMDAKSGKLISRALLWLVNRPSIVVATVLIGNNVANYLVSAGLLFLSQSLLQGWSEKIQTLLPVLLTPALFIYGELLPKYLYFQVPYRLLRTGAPLMLVCTFLFLPVSILIISLQWLWERLAGGEGRSTNVSLERRDLQRALTEGQEAGVVHPLQRTLAQNIFAYGTRPVRQFAIPLRAVATVERSASSQEIRNAAQRRNGTVVGILDAGRLVGCYRSSDIVLSNGGTAKLLPVCRVNADDSSIQVLARMHAQQTWLAAIEDEQRRLLGVLTRERLLALMLADQ